MERIKKKSLGAEILTDEAEKICIKTGNEGDSALYHTRWWKGTRF